MLLIVVIIIYEYPFSASVLPSVTGKWHRKTSSSLRLCLLTVSVRWLAVDNKLEEMSLDFDFPMILHAKRMVWKRFTPVE
jgi:hypothetical protein